MNEYFEKIEGEITQIKQENVRLKNSLEEASLEHERQIDALILEVIQVIDAYDKAKMLSKIEAIMTTKQQVKPSRECYNQKKNSSSNSI